MKKLISRAFAKLNLGLRVLGGRDDGYHEIETLFQSIDLHDTLTFQLQESPGIALTVQSPWLLPQEENLVYRAAQLALSRRADGPQSWPGVHIQLQKRIPVGAGLGGGSSDAAATLLGLNRLLQLQLSEADLHTLALALGSDVPYFLVGGLCRGRGRGEILERLSPRFQGYTFLLLKPKCSLSTAAVYSKYDRLIEQGWRPRAVRLSHDMDFSNDLEEIATRLHPELGYYRHVLSALQPDLLSMSGSGPTYYAGWSSPAAAREAAQELREEGLRVCLASAIDKGSELEIVTDQNEE